MKKMRLMVRSGGKVTYDSSGKEVYDTDEIDPSDVLMVSPNTTAGVRLQQGQPLLVRMERVGNGPVSVKTNHPLSKRKCLLIKLKKSAAKVLTVIVARRRRSNQYQVQIQL